MDELAALIADQAGMVARRQLNDYDIDWSRVRNETKARRWVERTPRVISTTTGVLTLEQMEWLAVLHAGPRSLLANMSAAARLGLKGWERSWVSVMVDDELSFEPVEGVRFFRSRRPFDLLRSPRPGIPVCRLEPAVLLWAGYQAPNKAAHAVVAAAIQQRLSTPALMAGWVDALRPLRRARALKRTIGFVAAGAHSGAELELGRLRRRFGIRPPDRQRRRKDRTGRVRWTDAEWDLPDGTVIALEIDGAFHMDVLQAADDAKRSRRLTTRTRIVVRCTAYELTHEADEVAVDLLALGLSGRVPETAL
jgi:hypothetical protein